ncbi:TetR/AcrR family transcriptional regulator [Pengzhenrongella sicca]|uniref:TetR family transcriptional regulator n=1 Tax=Pengzhenrongella sicca TaxID=2819238 RepID=A0A8A4ZD26_9MICO|nr:TetR/AcrR family transcriptional regulator [Pengzhenrongella sicca]QTE29814.1 TetR family transcriptional regulator [Pengzhenrongella sicca]
MSRLPMAARREQLVNAAMTVAIRDGIEAATVRAVAAEAGVSLGVVHYCFEDKNELLREVGHAITAQNVARVAFDPVPREQPSARAAIGVALGVVWDAMRENRGAQLLSYELTTTSLRTPELHKVAGLQLEHNWTVAERVLTEAAELAGMSWSVSGRSLARLAVAALDGVSLAWLVDGDDDAALAALSSFADHIATYARVTG